MSTNGFRDEELVTRRMKVGNEWQTRIFPVVGGRLRLAHGQNENLTLQTEMVNWDGQYAVFKCCAITSKGRFVGYGTANNQRDARLAESLVELAETRSVARALRFAGFGLEFTGAEEVSHLGATVPEREDDDASKKSQSVFPQDNGNSKPGRKAEECAEGEKSKTQGCGNGRATQAQVRALFALSKRANYHNDDITQMLAPFQVSRFEDLPRQAASQLIGSLQTEVAA